MKQRDAFPFSLFMPILNESNCSGMEAQPKRVTMAREKRSDLQKMRQTQFTLRAKLYIISIQV